MPTYSSAEALLSDARLRVDQLGGRRAILVVEGPDDKRLFSRWTATRQQVIATGGRTLLLSAHERAIQLNYLDIVFLTDCDYEVPLGYLLPGSPSLVITTHADVESDLAMIGGILEVVAELVPAANESTAALESISNEVMVRSVAIAEPLGRMRFVGRRGGFHVRTDIRMNRHRTQGTDDVDLEKIVQTVIGTSPECPHSVAELSHLIADVPTGYSMCNGHDLSAAVNQVLRDDFAVRGQTPDSIERLLRQSVRAADLVGWNVVQRLHAWENASDTLLFDRTAAGSLGNLI